MDEKFASNLGGNGVEGCRSGKAKAISISVVVVLASAIAYGTVCIDNSLCWFLEGTCVRCAEFRDSKVFVAGSVRMKRTTHIDIFYQSYDKCSMHLFSCWLTHLSSRLSVEHDWVGCITCNFIAQAH